MGCCVNLSDLVASLCSVVSSSSFSLLVYALDQLLHLQVVLDLDETLVCAYETCSLPANLRNQATEAGLKWFELECISSDKVSYVLVPVWFSLST